LLWQQNARYLGKTGSYTISVIVDGNDSNAKPDPEVFLIAAKLLRAKPEDAIVF
jgi:beta-phosphoglucomutase